MPRRLFESRRFAVVIGMAAFAGLSSAAPAAGPARTVTTESGRVAGKSAGTVSAFLGIPYAASTAGANRWRAPRPAPHWAGVRQATAFGPNCTQEPPYSPPGGTPWSAEYLPSGAMGEDCLSLNIWTPARSASERLPVLVWIHGGAFVGGSGSVPVYDGTALAARGILVVTINYRLGPLGFLAHPALRAEGIGEGNYGLLDQVAALRWIRDNIAGFGGDPARVTVAGQSAGAASVHALLAAPEAKGLFARAIAESGSGMGLDPAPRAEAESMGERFVHAAGAADLAGLRALPVETLLAAANDPSVGSPGPKFRPVADGAFLPVPLTERADVPVLTGLTADEASAGNPQWSASTPEALAGLVQARFGDQASLFAPFYQGGDAASIRAAARQLLRDRGLAGLALWDEARPAAAAPVYAYLYDHPEPGPDATRFGAFHSSEIPYVFGTFAASPDRPFTDVDQRIAERMMAYWVNFVRTGDPNGAGLPAWPSLGTGQLMRLGDSFAPERPLSPEKRAAYRAYVDQGGKVGLF